MMTQDRPEAFSRRVGRDHLPSVEVIGVSRRFGNVEALRDLAIEVWPGRIHALLGPNGAGKTTLVRILVGLVEPDIGEVRVLGTPWSQLEERASRRLFGLVPSSDRTFYLRLSGLENLTFFARLNGLSKAMAGARAAVLLREVDLEEAADRRVGTYSHGMHKRLLVARALLTDPPVLVVDEATHDLDPQGALRIQELVRLAASRGTAVVWATQRIDEIRGFADRVTFIHQGQARFNGSVPELMSIARSRRYILHLEDRARNGEGLHQRAEGAISGLGKLTPSGEIGDAIGHFLLELSEESILGDAVSALSGAGVGVLGCREERSQIEEAFLHLSRQDS